MHKKPSRKAARNQTAISWLSSDQNSADVLTMARKLIAIEQAAVKVMPPALARVCRVARIDRQQITLAVPSAAYASRLRQLAPRIVAQLTEGGWNLTEISVRVQADLLKTQTITPTPKEFIPLDHTALAAFDNLHSTLHPGPLADAVQKLLSRHRID